MPSENVTAIVPVYNRPRLVVEALDSIAGQTRLPEKLIIVDDGSTDDTAGVVFAWVEENGHRLEAEIVRQENRGVSAARNRGASLADAAGILAFLDSDDLWPPDYLERMTSLMEGNPELVGASCDRRDQTEIQGPAGNDRNVTSWEDSRFDKLPRETTRRLFVEGSPGTPNTVFRAGAFRKVGGYDESQPSLEDYQLMLRLSLLGPWGYTPGAPVLVRRFQTTREEASHLSSKDPAWRRRQAVIFEHFLFEEGGAGVIPERFWRPRLAHVWYRAGRYLEKSGSSDAAVECYAKALSLQWEHAGARFRWALIGLSGRKSRGNGSQ